MTDDRLAWIFSPTDEAGSLEAKYDRWAETYDGDHDEWSWRGPAMVTKAIVDLAPDVFAIGASSATIYDAGCGTGRAGLELRRAGFNGRLVGLDFSRGMLDVAAKTQVYDDLIKCSLYTLPLANDAADGIVSSGVFTHEHVGGEAFSELCRIASPGAIVTMTQRTDLMKALEPFSARLEQSYAWRALPISDEIESHPSRDDTRQVIRSWKVA